MTQLTRTEDVFILDLGDTENRFDPAALRDIETALDEVAAATGPAALVTTARGKFFSNGLDPESFAVPGYLDSFERVLARLLAFETPTVAACQGHVYAGGLLLALAHDERTMRADRGYICLPEIHIGFPFLPGMSRLVQAKLVPATAHAAMVTGRRYTGPEAVDAGLMDRVADEDELLEVAVRRAAELAPLRGPVLGEIKKTMYSEPLGLLGAKVPV